MKDECEKIQHYGHNLDETGATAEPDDAKCLRLIAESIKKAKKDFQKVMALMTEYYDRLAEESWRARYVSTGKQSQYHDQRDKSVPSQLLTTIELV